MEYIDRYFEIRLGNVSDEETTPLRRNERGALQGYLQSFDDKNGKWIDRLSNICNRIADIYNQKELQAPLELINLQQTICPSVSIKDRIKIPLKAFYDFPIKGVSELASMDSTHREKRWPKASSKISSTRGITLAPKHCSTHIPSSLWPLVWY